MEKLKRAKTVRRSSVTKQQKNVKRYLEEKQFNEAKAAFNVLEREWLKLHEKDDQILDLMLDDSSFTENDIEEEKESIVDYETKYEMLKVLLEDIETENKRDVVRKVGDDANTSKAMNLPPIKLEPFDGDLKNWLPFWGQFEQIHLDEAIPTFHKFRILTQSMKEGSRARQVVDSFPISKDTDNYTAAIDALRERFAREDLLIEVYIRELLGIIVKNSKSSNFSLVDMYDKLECHLRFLEILGVTTGKCAAILSPLLESCMPEEFLRVWQRSYVSDEIKDAEQRLTKLRDFMKSEVQNEQRISLAMSKFGISTEKPDKVDRKERLRRSSAEVPTAMGLLTTQESRRACCIFCEQSHCSTECFKARDMPLDEKLKRVRNKRLCYLCLKGTHSSKRCTKPSCALCDKKHAIILCPSFSRHRNTALSEKPKPVADKEEDIALTVKVASNANVTCDGSVILPTLRVKLRGKNGEFCIIRAVLDTAAQRSYVRYSVVEKMRYKANGQEALFHSLFGGKKTGMSEHKRYEIELSDIHGNTAHRVEVLGTEEICGDLPTVPKGPWIDEMKAMGIDITDILNDSGPIELLMGADIACTFFTGNMKRLSSGSLVGIETVFGWTISGRLPPQMCKTSSAMLVTTMLVNEMNVADFWRLDLLGIEDPSERKARTNLQEEARRHFLNTVCINEEGRYEVHLPWKEDHPVLPTNFELALKRLSNTRKKLENDGCLNEYEMVLQECLAEGIIEEVPFAENDDSGHYLPHRHVLKLNSTTKVRPVFDASAHEKHLPCLNQCLEKGCNLIEQIPPLLHKFRMNEIGVVADIRRAFLQISVKPSDRKFLKFLWQDASGKLIVYQHKRVVFGLTSSPFLLGAVIQYHLEKKREEFRQGNSSYSLATIETLLKSFYVDNVIVSLNSAQELHTFMSEATAIMAEYKFDLRGWEYSDLDCNPHSMTPVLGFSWNRKDDTLQLNSDNLRFSFNKVTKRVIMSVAHRVFDPLGIANPLGIASPKILLKEDLRSRFRNEYLGQLRMREKNSKHDEIKLNDVVLIGNDCSERIDWPLARVIELIAWN